MSYVMPAKSRHPEAAAWGRQTWIPAIAGKTDKRKSASSRRQSGSPASGRGRF